MQYQSPRARGYAYTHFRIDRSDFLKGSNTFDNYPDGGMQYSCVSYNPFAAPGYLTQAPSFNMGTPVTAGLLPTKIGISFGMGKGTLGQEVVVIGANASEDGYFYTMDESSGALTLVGSADTVGNYALGFTSTIFYQGYFYTTSKQDITRNVVALTSGSRDTSWWQTTKTMAALDQYSPHPQVVYGDIHYIADGRYIHQNDGGTTQYNVLDLGADWVITDMEIYNNLIYIAAEPYYNFSGTSHGLAKIFTWNGYADSWLDEWVVDTRISALYVYRGIMYVFTKKYMGYFTGSVVKNLYPVSTQVYKNQITTTSDSMWFADGTTVVRYGSPYLTGKLRFYRYFSTVSSSLNGIVSPYYEALSMYTTGASNGSDYYVADVNTPASSGSVNAIVKFNPRIFMEPVKIRGIVIQLKDDLTDVPTQAVGVGYYDDDGVAHYKTFSGGSATMVGKNRWRFDFLSQPATRRVLPYVSIQSNPYIETIDYLFDLSENKLNL